MTQNAKDLFSRELSQPDETINLARTALLMAQHVTRPFNTALYLGRLDEMAETIRPTVNATPTDLGKIEALNAYLFEEEGFVGNINNYYDPNNSFLDKVLDLKKGIPISLSVVYVEVGRRLDMPLWGIGMPRHFIVGYGPVDSPIYIDVFDKGHILSEDECLIISHVNPASRLAFRERYLKPVTKRAILFRMLQNLKGIYLGRKAWELAYKTVDLAVIVNPKQLTDRRDRGLLAYRLNRLQAAVLDLTRYLFLTPKDDNTELLEKRVELMEEQLLRLN